MKLNIKLNKISIQRKDKTKRDMSTVAIVGQLSFDVSDMIPVRPSEQFISVDKVLSKCSSILPHNIHWNTVDSNSWFISIHPQTKMSYCFPICESENSTQNYARPKNGLTHFQNKGYKTYKIS